MARKKPRTKTLRRRAVSRVAEALKRRRQRGNPFALAQHIVGRAGTAGRKRLARRGLRRNAGG